MVAVAERCHPPHCTNLWLDTFVADFDRAAMSLLLALGVRRASFDELRRLVRRAGRLSPAQARSSQAGRGVG